MIKYFNILILILKKNKKLLCENGLTAFRQLIIGFEDYNHNLQERTLLTTKTDTIGNQLKDINRRVYFDLF